MADPGFVERVRGVVGALPPGQVVTYGEVAEEAGSPGAAGCRGGGSSPARAGWFAVTRPNRRDAFVTKASWFGATVS